MQNLFLSLAMALAPLLSQSAISQLATNVEAATCQDWVDSVYNSLNERQRVQQLVIAAMSAAHGDQSRAAIKQMIGNNQVGGIIFSESPAKDFAEMVNYAQSLSNVPLLITVDGEWGPAMRVPEAPLFPKNMALGAIQDDGLLYDYGKEVARECRALGIAIDYAPVLDVNTNPANPVIGQRSYGEDPRRVANLGTAFSLGMEAGGVMAVGKHFPGHGDTSTDSHKALPQVDRSYAQLDTVELLPFKKFIDSGCNGIMVGHISMPQLDASMAPASMSRKITTGVLKDKLKFDGLIFTDGLGMKGAVVDGSNCVAALQAGADMLCGPTSVSKEVDAIMAAIDNGKLSKAEIEEKVKKVLRYKYILGTHLFKPIDTEAIIETLNAPEAAAVNRRISDACVTVLRNEGDLLPLGNLANNSIAIVNIGEESGNDFELMCRKYAHVDVYHGTSHLKDIATHATVIAAIYTDSQSAREQLEDLKSMPNLAAVFMVNPYKMGKFKHLLSNAKAIVTVYDNTKYTRQAAAKAIFGGLDVNGRFPVNVNGLAQVGDGIDLEKTRLGYASPSQRGLKKKIEERIDSAIAAALDSGAFPGGQLIVAKGGDIVIDRAFGNTTKGGEEVTDATLYDLASVSKTVGTLPGIMKIYDLGLIDLDEPASKIIPGLKVEGKSDLTPRMLLYHETGIRPSLDMFTMMMDPKSYKDKLYTSKPDKTHKLKVYNGLYANPKARRRTDIISNHQNDCFPHEAGKGIWVGKVTYDSIMNRIYSSPVKSDRKYVYSCLNFCLLMDLEQRITGQAHDTFVTDSVWAPIGAYGFCYRPTETRKGWSIASTENDVFMRKQHLRGYVHDELAAMSGGVQGNAGVFGTATDVTKICQLWLNNGVYGDVRIFSEETSKLFTTEKSQRSRRGLGFDKPDMEDRDSSPCCDRAGAQVYGHTGFTGTCFWVDPEHDLIYVFLCNRVDPTRSNSAFSQSSIRPVLMNIIYESIE